MSDRAGDVPALATRRFDLRGRTLRQHAARGVVINTAFMTGLSFLGLVRGFVLAGFLTRSDYGLWGITVVALGTLLTLRQVGIGDKYIQQDESDQELAFQKAFTMEAILTAISIAVLLVALPLFALAYGETDMILPGLLLVTMLPAGLLQMPAWAFYREMRFVEQRLIQSVEPVVGFAVALPLAILDAGYWALFVGVCAGAWSGAGVALLASPYRLRLRYDRATARSYWGFSWPLLLAAAGGMIIAQTSVFATDAHLGLAAVGALALAVQVAQFADRVDQLVTGTLYPAICAVADRKTLLLESFVKTNRLALMFAMPFGLGLSLFCADLVRFGIGARWEPAVPLLQAFGLTAAVGHLGFNWDAYFRALGQTQPMAVAATVTAAAFLLTGIPLLLIFDLPGLAVGVAIQTLVHVACRAYYLVRLFEGFRAVRHALRAVLPSVPAVGVVLLARVAFGGERTVGMAVVELVAYLGVTAVATWSLERRLLGEAFGYLSRRSASTVA